VRLDRGDLGRLIFERVEPMLIADLDLQRTEDRQHADAHVQHGARFGPVATGDDVARADREHDQRRGQVGRGQHVRQAIEEARIEDHGQPIDRLRDAVAHLEAGRRLHPGIGREDPKRRDRSAGGHEDRRHGVQPRWHALPAEQHDAEERRLQEERHQHFVADHRTDEIADDHRETAPVGAELVGQHQAGHNAHGERHGKDLGPEPRQPQQVVLAGHHPAHQQGRDEGGRADGEAWKNDVKRNGECELQASKQFGIKMHGALLAGDHNFKTLYHANDSQKNTDQLVRASACLMARKSRQAWRFSRGERSR
jgi:hypothetical protein